MLTTQADIPAFGQDNRYWLYYGNSLAAKPPAEKKKIYAYFSEFNVNVLDWATTGGSWGQAVTAGPDGRLTWAYRLTQPEGWVPRP